MCKITAVRGKKLILWDSKVRSVEELRWTGAPGQENVWVCPSHTVHEPTGPKCGSNHNIPWAHVRGLLGRVISGSSLQRSDGGQKCPFTLSLPLVPGATAGGQGTVTLFFSSAGRGELPKVRHLWDGKSSAVGNIISCESSQGSTVCLPCFGTSCLISVGFSFVPVTHCVSLQAFSWNRACPLLWGHEMPRKRGAKWGLRNLTSSIMMLIMALPVS